MSLNMSQDTLRIFDGTVFQESIESLFDKVKTCWPPVLTPREAIHKTDAPFFNPKSTPFSSADSSTFLWPHHLLVGGLGLARHDQIAFGWGGREHFV
jgi:hypothetical protein